MELVKFIVRFTELDVENYFYVLYNDAISKGNVIPLQAWCGWRYSSTLP